MVKNKCVAFVLFVIGFLPSGIWRLSAVGSVVLGFLGITGYGMIGGTIVSAIGACILIWIGRNMR